MIKDVPSVSNPLAMAVIVDEEEEPEKPCDPGNENASTGFFYTAKEHRNSLIFVDDSESIKEISEKPPVTHYQTVGLKVRVNTIQCNGCMNTYIHSSCHIS